MGFDALAYDSEESVLLVLDAGRGRSGVTAASELVAYDSVTEAPKWRTPIPDGAKAEGVVFVDASALPHLAGTTGSPWRAASSARVAAVVVETGLVHVVDLVHGMIVGTLGPYGSAAAMTTGFGAFAIATDEGIVLASGGTLRILTGLSRVSALAFSADASVLAIGTSDGALSTVALAALGAPGEGGKIAITPTNEAKVHSPIASIAQEPDPLVNHTAAGRVSWVVASGYGVASVSPSGVGTLEKLPSQARRVCFDRAGKRLAVQHGERAIAIYDWPGLLVSARVEYTDRPIHGLAFGPKDWLGVALDHGDGNKIDIVTADTHRTDTHPERQHRSWTLRVESNAQIKAARDAEDIRRMQSSVSTENTGSRSGVPGWRIAIGVVSISLAFLRLCARTSTPSYTPPPFTLPGVPTDPYALMTKCDQQCVVSRFERVATECQLAHSQECASTARSIVSSVRGGHCALAQASARRLSGIVASLRGNAPLLPIDTLTAVESLDTYCRTQAPAAPPLELARLDAKGTVLGTEPIPLGEDVASQTFAASYTAPDGTLFLALDEGDANAFALRRRSPTGAWSAATHVSHTSGAVGLLRGRSATEVYFASGSVLHHFDGASWLLEDLPDERLARALAVTASDVLVEMVGDEEVDVRRKTAKGWVVEALPKDTSLVRDGLVSDGRTKVVWGILDQPTATTVTLVTRSATGTWSSVPTKTEADIGSFGAWVSPEGEPFFAGRDGILLRVNGAWTVESDTAGGATHFWGRSRSDLYAGQNIRLSHFDGKTWTRLSYGRAEPVSLVGGANKELFVVRPRTN